MNEMLKQLREDLSSIIEDETIEYDESDFEELSEYLTKQCD